MGTVARCRRTRPLFCRHASSGGVPRASFSCGLLAVELQLFVEVAIRLAREEEAQPGEELGDHEDASGSSLTTRAMAVESRSQILELGFELLLSCARERVELRPSVVLREAPVGLDPAFVFEAMKRGVERALANPEDVL
jgi:hypothetical protein